MSFKIFNINITFQIKNKFLFKNFFKNNLTTVTSTLYFNLHLVKEQTLEESRRRFILF